jgi:hypothetical protein
LLCCAYPARIRPKVLFAVDQQVVEVLAAERSHIPLREGIARGARGGALITVTVDREPGRGSPGELEARHSRFLPRRKGRVRLTQVVWC